MRRARPLGQVTNACPPEPNCPLLPCYEECAHSEYVLSLVEPKLLNSQSLLKDLATSVLKVQEQWLQCVCEFEPDICVQGAQLGFSCVQCNAILETVYSLCDREEIECDGETYWFRDPCVSFRGDPCITECKKGYFDFTSSPEALALYTAIVEALGSLNLEFANLEAVEAMVQAIWGPDAFVFVKDCVYYIYPGENPSEFLISLSCIIETILPLPFCTEFRFIGGDCCSDKNIVVKKAFSVCDGGWINCGGLDYWWKDPCFGIDGDPCLTECVKGCYQFEATAASAAFYQAVLDAVANVNGVTGDDAGLTALVQAIWGADAFGCVDGCSFYIFPGRDASDLEVALSCWFEDVLPLPECGEIRFLCLPCCPGEIIVEKAFSVCDGGWVNCGGDDYWWKDPCFSIEGNACLTECVKTCFEPSMSQEASDLYSSVLVAANNVSGVITDDVGLTALAQEVWGPGAVGCVFGCRYYIFPGRDATELEVSLSCFFEEYLPLADCAEVRFLCLPCCPGDIIVEQAFSFCDGGWINCDGQDYWWKDSCFSVYGNTCLTECLTQCFDPTVSQEASDLYDAVISAVDNHSGSITDEVGLTAIAQEIWGVDAVGCVDGCSFYIFPGRDATELEVSLSLFLADVLPLPACAEIRFLCLPCCPHGQIIVTPIFSVCEGGFIICDGVEYGWRDGCISVGGNPCLIECEKACFDPNMSSEAFDLHGAVIEAANNTTGLVGDDFALTALVQEVWGPDALGCVDGCDFYIYPGREPSELEVSLSCFFAEKLPLLDCAEVRLMGLSC